ncbi:MAG TPA: hypothetical protein PK609_02140 [Candidatus Paceibacterota bacterium]|jgi:hypothetical protein|nr:hypothetical protein [Candidatus Paceibacterota bacterium]
MSTVSFDEERSLEAAPGIQVRQPALVKLVIRWGFAKDEKSAQMVLLGVIVLSIVIAISVPLLMRENEIPLRAPVVPMPAQTGGF